MPVNKSIKNALLTIADGINMDVGKWTRKPVRITMGMGMNNGIFVAVVIDDVVSVHVGMKNGVAVRNEVNHWRQRL